MSQSSILLNLQNTTPFVQPISVMNPNPAQVGDGGGSGNAPQNSYTYDISKEIILSNDYSFTYLSVIYSVNGGNYQINTIDYGSVLNSAQAFVNALNSLGQSLFYVINSTTIGCFSISPNGNNYYYSSISSNGNYTTNSFVGSDLYGIYGSLIYNNGYSINGVGTIQRINTSNTFWINSTPNTTEGRFNNSGVWSSAIQTPLPSSNGVGIYANINVSQSKNVYIGISMGYGVQYQLFVNNLQVLSTNDNDMSVSINNQIGVNSYKPIRDFWNIYPIFLNAGNNLISAYIAGNLIKDISFQVYDNTSAQIASATSYAGLNILFDSANYTENMI